MELHTLLGRIFQKTQRIVPKSAHRLITTFLGQYDDVYLSQPSAIEVRSPPHPAYWADSEGAWSADVNIYWSQGQWDD